MEGKLAGDTLLNRTGFIKISRRDFDVVAGTLLNEFCRRPGLNKTTILHMKNRGKISIFTLKRVQRQKSKNKKND